MSEPFIGQIMPWPINYAPKDWAFCDGRLLSIAEYSPLFALIGTTYGGDGRTTFGLPDLRGRVAVGAGAGPGLTNYYLGQSGGMERVTLTANNLPEHTHPTPASTTEANEGTPTANIAPAAVARGSEIYASPVDTNLAPTGNNTTSNQPVENRMPLLALNYIIALNGIWPSRP
ncbi:MAG: phage tail protein [candidate division Zixibacteria bacterium]|nr:phage tail protein [Gammaproteobacteria bacterium]NIR63864.1 phage tail protein [candidate division Zixibacteria bacterium]NIX00029.1 phage tail protein [Phycisphaerae bacterium]